MKIYDWPNSKPGSEQTKSLQIKSPSGQTQFTLSTQIGFLQVLLTMSQDNPVSHSLLLR